MRSTGQIQRQTMHLAPPIRALQSGASQRRSHQYNYTTISTSSGYYPATSTTKAAQRPTTGTYSTSETYEDGAEHLTDTWTEFATASTHYSSSNWTAAAGPTVTTGTYSHTITTTTVRRTATRASTTLASNSYSVADTLIDLALIIGRRPMGFTTVSRPQKPRAGSSPTWPRFTKTTVTASPGGTIRDYSDISSAYIPTSCSRGWTNTTRRPAGP